ncbi:hypothetical protein IF1G_06896 [Cordyceps javanica]|uniref:Uncharacterized protein n=1 Tax=Cordyceps javanica TaxID=43265 RepID=A0A545UZI5_9HYPO|nr:hypothetical protein IF1G_06896 [Cordyceps javanica]
MTAAHAHGILDCPPEQEGQLLDARRRVVSPRCWPVTWRPSSLSRNSLTAQVALTTNHRPVTYSLTGTVQDVTTVTIRLSKNTLAAILACGTVSRATKLRRGTGKPASRYQESCPPVAELYKQVGMQKLINPYFRLYCERCSSQHGTMGELISHRHSSSHLLTIHYKGLLALTRRCIDRSPYLAERSLDWPEISDLRSRLLCLLERKSMPELCLLLAKTSNGAYDWTPFRASRHAKFFSALKLLDKRSREAVVINIYLSHLAQLCHEAVPDGEFLVLDPEELVAYRRTRQRVDPNRDLACVLKTMPVVPLVPGKWQDGCAVLKWRASLAVWRKHDTKHELLKGAEDPPPMYSTGPPPPAYESCQVAGRLLYDDEKSHSTVTY